MSKYSRLVHAERGDTSRILLIADRFNRFSLLHAEMSEMADRLVQRDRSRVSKAVIEETVEMSVRLGESLSLSELTQVTQVRHWCQACKFYEANKSLYL